MKKYQVVYRVGFRKMICTFKCSGFSELLLQISADLGVPEIILIIDESQIELGYDIFDILDATK